MRFQLTILLLAVCGAAFAQSARPEQAAAARIDLIDRIVAVVNKEVITQYDLAERMNRVQKELQRRGTSLPDRGEIERQVLERLIIEKVQLQYARETGVRVDDLELDRTLSRVAEGNKLSLTEFRQTLERDAIPSSSWKPGVPAPRKRSSGSGTARSSPSSPPPTPMRRMRFREV